MITTQNVERDKLSPMLLHYIETKEKYSDDIVLFRVGDFFEAYFEDAHTFSQVCGLVKTEKKIGSKGTSDDEDKLGIPMAGVPHKTLNTYAQELINSGHRVVVVEQTEDPKEAKGRMVKRDIVAILSGMNKDGEYLTEYQNNFVCVIYNEDNIFGLCFADIATSEIFLTTLYNKDELINEIAKYKPSEVIVRKNISEFVDQFMKTQLRMKTILTIDDNVFEELDENKLCNCFGVKNTNELNCNSTQEVFALISLINYIEYTQKTDFVFTNLPKVYTCSGHMSIDMYSRVNLELTENSTDRSRNGTLFSAIDYCRTSMGRRLLNQWIEKPLQKKNEIENRLNGVEELFNNINSVGMIQEDMCKILDIARILGRIRMNRCIPRDLVNLRESIAVIPSIKKQISSFKSDILRNILIKMDDMTDLYFLLEKALMSSPAGDVRDGDVFKSGYSKDLDVARDMIDNSNKYLCEFEERERVRTGIKGLKVINILGRCVIEISATSTSKGNIPEDYRIEKALKNRTRYVNDESEKLEKDLLSAQEKTKRIQIELYDELLKVIMCEEKRILALCDAIACLDVLCGFASVSTKFGYTRPHINNDGIIDIRNGRHVVVERNVDNFIENDAFLDENKNNFIIITGPNMAGKSTYMRQIALITVMAHIGCFVPAEYVNISIVDKIFTRIGASDDIASGRSTYMVEMTEVNNILNNATKNSLILLDEVGRGTSTSDGLSIARALVEYIYNKIGAKTLFATHYHELISLENDFDGVCNCHLSAKKINGVLTFVRKVEPGGLEESYGIDVAELAGLPSELIDRAREILDKVDDRYQKSDITDFIKNIEPSEITPVSAYKILHDLIALVNK